MKKRGLNKGLDSLLGDLKSFRELNINQTNNDDNILSQIELKLIKQNPKQPRKYFDPDEIQGLADSIKSQGIIQPIVVKELADTYQIIAGERRFRAAQIAGLIKIPAIIRNIDDKSASLLSVIENLQRENLNPIEQANSFNQLIKDFNYTHEQLAKYLGLSRAQISNTLRLLKLSNEIKQALVSKQIDTAHARSLISLSSEDQKKLLFKDCQQKLSARKVEELVKKHQQPKNTMTKTIKAVEITDLEEKLADQLGLKVQLTHHKNNSGVLKIYYSSLESLDGVIEKIK